MSRRRPHRPRRRWLHRIGWYRNDMRRTSDRWEVALAALLMVVFVAGVPLVAVAAGRHTYRGDVRQQNWNRAHRIHTEAVLLTDATAPVPTDGTDGTADTAVAAARWAAPDGAERRAMLQVMPGARAGARAGLWMDEHGWPAPAPSPLHPAADAANVAVIVVLAGAVALLILRLLLRLLLYRRGLRRWQEEWVEVGPRWSRHR